MKVCLDCGAQKSRKGNYCKECGYKHRKRPMGLRYVLHKDNPTSFKKGSVPWNKNTKGIVKANNGSIKIGERRSPDTEFKYKNGNGYRHLLLKGILNKECNDCGEKNMKRLQVHHRDHNRKNNTIDNLIVLCRPCHLQKHNRVERVYVEGRVGV